MLAWVKSIETANRLGCWDRMRVGDVKARELAILFPCSYRQDHSCFTDIHIPFHDLTMKATEGSVPPS